jgi:hypothetical protein
MHEAGAWIVISKPRVTIPAHGQLTDNFTLTVPTTASPGEHLGAVVTSANVGTTPQGSVIEARTALIVVVTVPGSDHPSATLSPLRGSTAVPGQFSFAITLSNTGNLLLAYIGSVAVYDGHGRRVARLPLAPADAYVVPAGHVSLAAIWADTIAQSGTYRAQAVLTILANGKPVGALTSQSLALSLASRIPIPSIIAIALGCGLIRWPRRVVGVALRLSSEVAPSVDVDRHGPLAAEGSFVRRQERHGATTAAGTDCIARSSQGRA